MLHEDEGVGVDAALASRRRQGEERKSGPLLLCYRQGERESKGAVHVGVRTREERAGPRCRVVVRERVREHRPRRVVVASSEGGRVRVCWYRRQGGRE